MRCHEAKRRLARLFAEGHQPAFDPRLAEHLDGCAACAALARAERTLERDLATASQDNRCDTLPLAELRQQVEIRARAITTAPNKEIPLMSRVARQLKSRPGLGFSLSLAAAALLVTTLVPFSFHDTIGYEVALAGVSPDLAMDEYRVQELLNGLGLEGATFEVSDCTATCKLKVGDLKSQRDVKIVVAAFDELGNCAIEDVRTCVGEVSTTLVTRLKDKLHGVSEGVDQTGLTIDLVSGCLDSLAGDSTFSVWITKGCLSEISEDSTPDTIVGIGLNLAGGACAPVWRCRVDTDTSDSRVLTEMAVLMGGNTVTVDGARPIDAEAAKQLTAMGYRVERFGDSVVLYWTDGAAANDSDQTDPAAKAESPLPEGFELRQNYPNPFNPNTSIEFTLPSSQHVVLEIINVNGQVVTTLLDKTLSAGTHTIDWDATDSHGDRVASGVYFYHLTAGSFSDTKKMTLLK